MSAERWHDTNSTDLIGTRAERAQLFEHLVAATLRRQAISPAKNRLFGIDVARDMGRHRDALLDASTPAELWYALNLLSNTRHDRHLQVEAVPGGLTPPADIEARKIRNYGALDSCGAPRLDIELATDFGGDRPRLFLAAVAPNLALPAGLEIGAFLIAVNGLPLDQYIASIEPYHCYSTPTFFWYHLPHHIVRQGSELPAHSQQLLLTFETASGPVDITLPYRDPKSFIPPRPIRYAGWSCLGEWDSCRLHLAPDAAIIALEWLGFGPTLCADVDALMALCAEQGLLGHDLIFDASISRGGDYGGYLLRVLAKTRFRINLGDLRRCDAIAGIIEEVLAEDDEALASGRLNQGQVAATGWRKRWLLEAVLPSLSEDGSTPAVPFKCAHQPMDGDGWLEPAETHFTGPMVMLTMPFGGSHIDQVAAQIADNQMCIAHIGMPLGGFSKTWVGTEILRLPSGQPIAAFQWSCGNTIRPNGEVLESNPAIPDRPFPVTRDNYRTHHADMLDQACALLLGRG